MTTLEHKSVQPLLLRVEDDVLLELGGAEARAREAQDVVGEREQGAVHAEARVQAHAQSEQDVRELLVCEGCELLVVVDDEVFDEKGGHEAGAQREDAEGHGAGEGVSDFLLHDAAHERDVLVVHAAFAEAGSDVFEDDGGAQSTAAYKVRYHLTPEKALVLREPHDDSGPLLLETVEGRQRREHVAQQQRLVHDQRFLEHGSGHQRAESVLHPVHQVHKLLPRVVAHFGRHERVHNVHRVVQALRQPAAAPLAAVRRHVVAVRNSRNLATSEIREDRDTSLSAYAAFEDCHPWRTRLQILFLYCLP